MNDPTRSAQWPKILDLFLPFDFYSGRNCRIREISRPAIQGGVAVFLDEGCLQTYEAEDMRTVIIEFDSVQRQPPRLRARPIRMRAK